MNATRRGKTVDEARAELEGALGQYAQALSAMVDEKRAAKGRPAFADRQEVALNARGKRITPGVAKAEVNRRLQQYSRALSARLDEGSADEAQRAALEREKENAFRLEMMLARYVLDSKRLKSAFGTLDEVEFEHSMREEWEWPKTPDGKAKKRRFSKPDEAYLEMLRAGFGPRFDISVETRTLASKPLWRLLAKPAVAAESEAVCAVGTAV